MRVKLRMFVFSFLLMTSTQFGWAQLQSKPTIFKEVELVNPEHYSGVIAEHYANGSPKLWKTLVAGKAEGLWLEWYPDGTSRYKAYWKNGLGHGKWEYFYPNGQLRSESFYIEDVAQGIHKSYFDNGRLQNETIYLDGKKIGLELNYDATGTLINRSYYDDGRLVIDQPTLFEPGRISDLKSNEWGISFAPDGNTAYFTRRDGATKLKRIYEIKKTENGWSEPQIAPFSTGDDEAPFVNSQGTKLFFASFRPLPDGSTQQKADNNIWYMNQTSEGWSEPQPVQGNINHSQQEGNTWPTHYEAGPVSDKEGNLYYWAKGTQSNVTNLYFAPLKADGIWGKPIELIEPSNHKHFDSAPMLSPDGNILFFVSDNRADALGGADIYYAKKRNGVWTKPKNLSPQLVNSYYDDGFPSFSPDGKYFFFSSTRAGNKDEKGDFLWDIYYIETKFLIIE